MQDNLSLAMTQLRMSMLLSLKKLIIINLKIINIKNGSADEIAQLLEDYNLENEELQTDLVLLERYKARDLLINDSTLTSLIEKRISKLKQLTEVVIEILDDKKEQFHASFNNSLKFSKQGNLIS